MRKKKKVFWVTCLLLILALLGITMLGGCDSNKSATINAQNNAKGKKPVIALSNSYYGNIWRKQMVDSFEKAAKKAKAEGLISDYIILNGDGTVNQQMAQLNDLILKKVDAICINAASPTALNGLIAKAEKAGITVISFDSVVTEPNAYKFNFDFKKQGRDVAQYVVDRLKGHGNVIIVRGVAGSAPDADMYEGNMSVLKKYPGIHVVAVVQGQCTTSITESKISSILPSLPKVDAVLCQGGGDDYGVVQAFKAAKRPMPIITGSGSAEFIRWWIEEYKKNGYETYSENSGPSIGGAVFWVALNILNGMKAPKEMIAPNVVITKDNLMDYADLPPNTIAAPDFSNEWIQKHIFNKK